MILSSPVVYPITYDDDANRTQIDAFFRDFAASSAWAEQTAEYGVGLYRGDRAAHPRQRARGADRRGRAAAPRDEPHRDRQRGGPLGAPNPNGIYVFFIPEGTQLDDGSGSDCCTGGYDGYHDATIVNGVQLAYSINCACPGLDGPDVTELQQLTIVASHETIEAATDPFLVAWNYTDDAHAAWTYITEGELGDMCEFASTAFYIPTDMKFAIQRTWSNAAARDGHDPCVSEPEVPYYQAVPDQPDPVTISYGGGWATSGVHIAEGSSGAITLHVYADADPGPLTINVADYSSDWEGGKVLLQITQPSGTFSVGDTVTVPVTVNGIDPSLHAAEVFVVSTASAHGPTTYFYGLVSQ